MRVCILQLKLFNWRVLLTVVPAARARRPPAPPSPVGSGPPAPPPLLAGVCSPSPRSSAATPAGAPAPPDNPETC